MLLARAFHSVIIALCVILSSFPSPHVTDVVPAFCVSFCDQHPLNPGPAPTCNIPSARPFPEPAIIGFIMEGKYLLKGTSFITPTSRVVQFSNVWIDDDIGDGYRLFRITHNSTTGHWHSLNLRDLSCIGFLMALILITAAIDKSSVSCDAPTDMITTPTIFVSLPYHTARSDAGFTIGPTTESSALVRSSSAQLQLVIAICLMVSLKQALLRQLLQEHGHSLSVVYIDFPLVTKRQLLQLPSDIHSVSDFTASEDLQLARNTFQTIGYVVRFKFWVLLREGWRLYTGARLVNDQVASFLQNISRARLQKRISDVEFTCLLTVRQLFDCFDLEFVVTCKTGSALGWYPPPLPWQWNNDDHCKEIKASCSNRNASVYDIRVHRHYSSIILINNALLRQLLVQAIDERFLPIHRPVLPPSPAPILSLTPQEESAPSTDALIGVPTTDASTQEDCPAEAPSDPQVDSALSRQEKKAQRSKAFREHGWFKDKKKQTKKAYKARKARERAEQRAAEGSAAAGSSAAGATTAANAEVDSSSHPPEPTENDQGAGPSRRT